MFTYGNLGRSPVLLGLVRHNPGFTYGNLGSSPVLLGLVHHNLGFHIHEFCSGSAEDTCTVTRVTIHPTSLEKKHSYNKDVVCIFIFISMPC